MTQFTTSYGHKLTIEGKKVTVVNKFGDRYVCIIDENGKLQSHGHLSLMVCMKAMNEYKNSQTLEKRRTMIQPTDNLQEFVKVCKTIGNNLNTIVDVKDYSQYGWGQVSFMTDRFGGVYVCLHYDMNTKEVVNWYGEKSERRINDISNLSYFVKDEMKKALKERNLDKVYERINEEY